MDDTVRADLTRMKDAIRLAVQEEFRSQLYQMNPLHKWNGEPIQKADEAWNALVEIWGSSAS